MDLQEFYRKHKGLVLSLLYIVFPIDLIPEAFLGPVGLVDDTSLFAFIVGTLILRALGVGKRTEDNQEKPSAS